MSHTKDPWSLFDAGNDIHLNEKDGPGFVGSIHIYEHRAEECRENARRIVACVNACKGIPTVALMAVGAFGGFSRDQVVEYVTKQRDELMAVLEGIESVTPHHMAKRINDVIASVKGSAS